VPVEAHARSGEVVGPGQDRLDLAEVRRDLDRPKETLLRVDGGLLVACRVGGRGYFAEPLHELDDFGGLRAVVGVDLQHHVDEAGEPAAVVGADLGVDSSALTAAYFVTLS
jgi:hypothetical protein